MRSASYVPAPGAAVPIGAAWCARPTAERALIVAPRGSLERWRRLVQRSIVSSGRVRSGDAAAISAVSLIGPRAARVLAEAGVCESLLPGAAVAGALAEAPAVVVCEAPDRFLLLVEADADSAAWASARTRPARRTAWATSATTRTTGSAPPPAPHWSPYSADAQRYRTACTLAVRARG